MMRSFGRSALLAMLAAWAAAEPARAQGECAGMVEAGCLSSLGAGAFAAGSTCELQWDAYRICVAAASAGAPAPSPAGAVCSDATANTLWASASATGDCAGFEAFRRACPGTPQATMAEGLMRRLDCVAAAGAATPTPEPAPTGSAPEHACDRLAARPVPGREGGVEFDAIDAPAAIGACAEALAAHPTEARFADLLGRAHAKAEDAASAAIWLRKGAELGSAASANAVGALYERGQGVVQSDTEAARWYRRAAEAGDVAALTNLGRLLRDGRGVARDDVEAARWLERAGAAGNTRAMALLGAMRLEGRGGPPDDAAAADWVRRAAERDDALAMGLLGRLYAEGRGVGRDDERAVAWLTRAAETGDPGGMSYLGFLYYQGRGVGRDYSAARHWLEKADAAGPIDGEPAFVLGTMHEKGFGAPVDLAAARRWYFRALELEPGHRAATKALVRIGGG